MQALISQLPRYDHFVQNWDHRQTNWLPFYWKGFSQTTRYTYRIEDLKNSDEIWAGLQQNIRTDIKKAANRENLKIRDDLPLSDFYALEYNGVPTSGKSRSVQRNVCCKSGSSSGEPRVQKSLHR